MRGNAKDKFKKATEELCCAHEHLNKAYMKADDSHNKIEIHAALKAVAGAIENAQNTLDSYKD